ncbi:MAG TPA: DUF2860 family protein [Pelagibacterium sp.]|uniref:DUF2860 family protein n=1 Tax=Pelagibacterium sp. TaxID=1967288 RepID=UPI002C770FC9|nr:DUF2860 family protein [Pelagibacterium sp.]HWJ86619.1 DUF2860 family protein [Pelagibacterium sp.]
MKSFIVSLALAAGAASAPTIALGQQSVPAAETPDLLTIRLAAELLAAGQAIESCMVLDIAAGPETEYVPALMLYGDCHLEQGKVGEAAEYFNRALVLEPDSEILSARIEEIANIEAFLFAPEPITVPQVPVIVAVVPEQEIESPVQETYAPRFGGSVSLTRGFDSNVNNGTYHSVVDAVIGGVTIPLTMSPESRARATAFTRLAAEYGVLQQFTNDSAGRINLRIDAALHDQWSDDHDKAGIALSGRYILLGEDWSLSLGPDLLYTLAANGSHSVTAGLAISGGTALDERFDIVGSADLRFETFPHDTNKDALKGSTQLGLVYDLGNDWTLGAAVLGHFTEKSAAMHSFKGIGARLSLDGPLTETLSLAASYSVTRDFYAASPIAFPQDRIDVGHDFSIGLDFDVLDVDGLNLFARYNYQRTDSTVAVYDTDRHVVSTGLRLSF